MKNIKGITTPVEEKYAKNVYWMYGIVIENEFGTPRDELKKKLFEAGIDTRYFFWPMHAEPCFKQHKYNPKDYPVSTELSKKGLYLPSGLNLTEEQIKTICKKIEEVQSKK